MTSLILCLLGDALCNRYFIKIFTYINIPGIICPPRILEVKHTQHFFTIGFCNALVAFITEFPLRFPSWRSQTTMLLKGTTKRYNLKRDFNLWLLENGNFDIMQRALAGSPRRGVLTRESCRAVALQAIAFSIFAFHQLLIARLTVWPAVPKKVWWVGGALHTRKHTLIIYQRASLDIQWSTTMKKTPTAWGEARTHTGTPPPQEPATSFPGSLPRVCSSLSTWSHVVPFFWGFYAPSSSFLCPVYMQETHTPGRLPSDFPPTSTPPPSTILFISLIHSFLVLTLHLSLRSLLTQPVSTAINILRNLAPPKNL